MQYFKLPDFEVIVHIKQNDFSKSLEDELLQIMSGHILEESTEYGDAKDFHWEFSSMEDAISAAESLKTLCSNPNLLLLKAKSNKYTDIKPVIHKP